MNDDRSKLPCAVMPLQVARRALPATPAERRRTRLRASAAALFVAAGVNHFVHPEFYRQIVPPGFPSPAVLVALSGACEIVGGVGLLIPSLRRAAGWGLIALLAAVFPANVYMATSPEHFSVPAWALWIRLPLQAVLIGWVWRVALSRGAKPREEWVDANAAVTR